MNGYRAETWEKDGSAWHRTYTCDQLAYATDFVRWESPGKAILGSPDAPGRMREHALTKLNGVWATDACEAVPTQRQP